MDNERKHMGMAKKDVLFPVAPNANELDKNYIQFIDLIKTRIKEERLRALVIANKGMMLLYWDLGALILDKQKKEGWGAKVIDRIANLCNRLWHEFRGVVIAFS